MTSPLRISTLVDLDNTDRNRTMLQAEIDKLALDLNNLQIADPRGYYNQGRQKARARLKSLQERLAKTPSTDPNMDGVTSAPAPAPIFSGPRIEVGRVGVSDLKLNSALRIN